MRSALRDPNDKENMPTRFPIKIPFPIPTKPIDMPTSEMGSSLSWTKTSSGLSESMSHNEGPLSASAPLERNPYSESKVGIIMDALDITSVVDSKSSVLLKETQSKLESDLDERVKNEQLKLELLAVQKEGISPTIIGDNRYKESPPQSDSLMGKIPILLSSSLSSSHNTPNPSQDEKSILNATDSELKEHKRLSILKESKESIEMKLIQPSNDQINGELTHELSSTPKNTVTTVLNIEEKIENTVEIKQSVESNPPSNISTNGLGLRLGNDITVLSEKQIIDINITRSKSSFHNNDLLNQVGDTSSLNNKSSSMKSTPQETGTIDSVHAMTFEDEPAHIISHSTSSKAISMPDGLEEDST